MLVTAINPKHQPKVTRLVHANQRYNSLVNEGREETPAGEKVFDNLYELWSDLPVREIENIEKSIGSTIF